ncbi:MAG: hypothetical protein AAGK00_02055 [Pseudomonadota bacterium]
MKLSDWIDRQPVRVGFGRGGSGAIVDGSGSTGGSQGLTPPPNPISLPDFGSRAEVESAIIDQEIPFIRTAGYYQPGDQGGGLYVRRQVEPVHNLKIQSADGSFWELVVEKGRVTEKQAGGIGDGIADDTRAIQDAIDFVIYHDGTISGAISAEVVIVGPLCRLTDTIHLGYGEHFHSVAVKGTARKHNAETSFVGTGLISDFTDRPIISIQGCFGTRLSDLWIDGALPQNTIDFESIEATEEATWDALGGEGRYNPYAAITVDAYSGPRPAQSYPDVTYPPFLTQQTQYNRIQSSDIRIDNVGIRYVNTAIVVQPCDYDGNGDFVKIQDCEITRCKYGISIGNSQSRNVEISNLNSAFIHTLFTNCVHGRQSGQFGGPILNASSGGFLALVFKFNTTAFLGTLGFINLYVENLHKIGEFTGNTLLEHALEFSNSQFRFRHNADRGVPPAVMDGAHSSEIIFRGCRFGGTPSIYSFSGQNHRFEYCIANVDERGLGTVPAYQMFAHNATAGGIITNAILLQPQGIGYRPYNLETGGAVLSRLPKESLYRDTSRVYCVPHSVFEFLPQSEIYGTPVRKRIPLLELLFENHFSSVSLVGRTLTLEFDTLSDTQAMYFGVLPGDIVRHVDTATIFFIRSRSGTTVIAEAQNNYISDGSGGYELLDPVPTTAGLIQFFNSRIYTPTASVIMDFTQGSNVATNVGRPDGFAGFLENDIKPGDHFYVSGDEDSIMALASSRVVSIDQTARTITFAGNAQATVSRKRAGQWLRTAPPNA